MISRRAILGTAAASVFLAGCSDHVTSEPDQARTTDGAATITAGTPAPSALGSADSSPTEVPVRTGPVVEIGHGPRNIRKVALTFHGAGEHSIAQAVLGELRRGNVFVTVMAVGSWLDTDRGAAHLALDDGHELGNHTEHHLPMRGLSEAVARREIEQCAATLSRITGNRGNWFRASGTQHTTPRIRAAAAAAGYRSCLSYDVDSLDWSDPAPAQITRTVMAQVRPGSIVSLHLGHRGTIAAIPPLLDALRAAHLDPVTVSHLLG